MLLPFQSLQPSPSSSEGNSTACPARREPYLLRSDWTAADRAVQSSSGAFFVGAIFPSSGASSAGFAFSAVAFPLASLKGEWQRLDHRSSGKLYRFCHDPETEMGSVAIEPQRRGGSWRLLALS